MNSLAFIVRRGFMKSVVAPTLISLTALAAAAPPARAVQLEWEQLSPSSSMSERTQASMAYDSQRDRMLVFGGTSGLAYLNDLWQWPLATAGPWARIYPTGAPPDAFSQIFYDAPGDRLVAFASGLILGLDFAGSPRWTNLTPTGIAPPPRPDAAVAHDPQNQRLIIYGGGYVGNAHTDVWIAHLGASPYFEQVVPEGPEPFARAAAGAVYDPVGDRLIVFGGTGITSGATGYFSDVWALSLGAHPTWQLLSASAPFQGFVRGIHYVHAHKLLVPYGGHVWALPLSGGPWEAWDPEGLAPGAAIQMASTFLPEQRQLAVFGGRSAGVIYSDLWRTTLPAPVTGVESPQLESGLALAVTPNPARGGAFASFTLPASSPVRIEVLDLAGRRVAARELGTLEAGPHRFELPAGRPLDPGVYFLRLAAAGVSRTTRFVALR